MSIERHVTILSLISFSAAYFDQRSVESLGVIDDIPGVGGIAVPEGYFRSARAMKGRRDEHRRGPGGQLLGPVADYSQPLSAAPGALYTIFPSSNLGSSSTPEPRSPSTNQSALHHHPHYGSSRTMTSTESSSTHPSSYPRQVPNRPATLHPSSADNLNHSPPHSSVSINRTEQLPILVPLEDLEACSKTWRDPTDEQFLRQLTERSGHFASRSRHSSMESDVGQDRPAHTQFQEGTAVTHPRRY